MQNTQLTANLMGYNRRNQYLEWEEVRNQVFQEQDNTHLYNRIIELENKLKHIRDKYGINE